MSESENEGGGDLSLLVESLRDLPVLGFSLEGLLGVERAYLGSAPGMRCPSSSASSKYATEGVDFFAMPRACVPDK